MTSPSPQTPNQAPIADPPSAQMRKTRSSSKHADLSCDKNASDEAPSKPDRNGTSPPQKELLMMQEQIRGTEFEVMMKEAQKLRESYVALEKKVELCIYGINRVLTKLDSAELNNQPPETLLIPAQTIFQHFAKPAALPQVHAPASAPETPSSAKATSVGAQEINPLLQLGEAATKVATQNPADVSLHSPTSDKEPKTMMAVFDLQKQTAPLVWEDETVTESNDAPKGRHSNTLDTSTPLYYLGKKRHRTTFPDWITKVLEDWLFSHPTTPYPSEEEKAALAASTGLQLSQINNWLSNARRRKLPALKEKAVA